MSQVTITDIYEGETATITSPNATITSWNAADSPITRANVREEGITRRLLNYGSISPPSGRSRIQTDTNLFQAYHSPALVPPALATNNTIDQTSRTLNEPILWRVGAADYVGLGPLTLNTATQDMEINFSCSFNLDSDNDDGDVAAMFKLIYSVGSAPASGWSDFLMSSTATSGYRYNPTIRGWGFAPLVTAGEVPYNGAVWANIPLVQSVTITHKISHTFNPINSAALYIGVYAWLENSAFSETPELIINRATLEAHTWSA